MSISLNARQRFRVRLQNIEDADEILNALNNFVERFNLLSGVTNSSSWTTIYTEDVNNNQTKMITLSIIADQGVHKAGFKRTGVFYKLNNVIDTIQINQSDYSSKTDTTFDARLVIIDETVHVQVKSINTNQTTWNGSIEIEKLGE